MIENPTLSLRVSCATARRFFRVQGIVQGVGFRPFISRLATRLELTGTVSNTSRGVEIEVQGDPARLDAFDDALLHEAPPMALILEVERSGLELVEEQTGFAILASRTDPVSSVVIPPDIATSPACLEELGDPSDRRHRNPFLN